MIGMELKQPLELLASLRDSTEAQLASGQGEARVDVVRYHLKIPSKELSGDREALVAKGGKAQGAPRYKVARAALDHGLKNGDLRPRSAALGDLLGVKHAQARVERVLVPALPGGGARLVVPPSLVEGEDEEQLRLKGLRFDREGSIEVIERAVDIA